MPKPMVDEVLLSWEDVENAWPGPSQSDFDKFPENVRETRHAIDHEGSELKLFGAKKKNSTIRHN